MSNAPQPTSHAAPSSSAGYPDQSPEWRSRARRLQGVAAPVLSPGERDALYEEFQPLVRRLMRQYGETPEQREELQGEIYLRFCEILAAYEPGRGVPLRPYLVRMLTASVYTYSRAHWRRKDRELSLEVEFALGEPAGEDPSTEWLGSLAQEAVLAQLPLLIARLPQRQQQVVIGRYYENCSFAELAERLQVQQATVRSLLRHGLNNLRRALASTEQVSGE
jgi:RNA polymerase sigma factor (sigma-70 family)